MSREENKEPTIVENIKSNWFLIIFIAGMIGTWTKFGLDIQQHSIEISKINSEIQDMNIKLDTQKEITSDLKGDLKAIKESLEYIKKRI